MSQSEFIRRIQPGDVEQPFKCGTHRQLDHYFKKLALRNDELGCGTAYVLIGAAGKVLGYYTISSSTVPRDLVEAFWDERMPGAVPVTLLGRFAVQKTHQGQGCGKRLLVDAFRRLLEAARSVGSTGMLVDAKDARSAAFYAKAGFTTIATEADGAQRMFIPKATIAKADSGAP